MLEKLKINLKDKIILVTGSSYGIGFSIAKVFIENGAKVVFNSRSASNLKKALKKINSPNAFSITADVTKPDQAIFLINEIQKKFGKINHIICNVGSGKSVSPGNESYEEWQRIFHVNFWSATNIIEASKDILAFSKGSIVCISSICGEEVILNAPITYSVAKAALNSYVKGISKPLGKLGVRINAISPGNILFKGSVWDKKLKEDPAMVEEIIEKEVPLGKLGDTDEIAYLSLWLVSSYASFCTGSVFTIDGGQTRSL